MAGGSIAGVILAGGRASRMGGGDKCLRLLGGEPILAHVIRRLAPQVETLALNANGDPSRFEPFGLTVLADADADFKGPLAGILAGLQWAASAGSFPHLLTVAADTPFFPKDLAQRLAACLHGDHRIAVATSAGRPHPVFALWPLDLRDDLADFIAAGRSLKVADFLARHPVAYAEFPLQNIGGPEVDPFFNINTPDELDAAERLMSKEET